MVAGHRSLAGKHLSPIHAHQTLFAGAVSTAGRFRRSNARPLQNRKDGIPHRGVDLLLDPIVDDSQNSHHKFLLQIRAASISRPC